MDRIAAPQDDLFEQSTMTFGEHLEELRQSLTRALLWLAGGMIIGLFFSGHVIRYIQEPLEQALRQFHADRAVYEMGYDPKNKKNETVQQFGEFLSVNGLTAEVVYPIPGKFTSPVAASQGTEELEEIVEKLPDLDELKPQVVLRQTGGGLSSFKLEEPFLVYVKAGLIVGAVITSPAIFYHLWSFVAAGLYAHERRYVYIYMPISVGLFVSGVVLAFFLVLQFVLTFLLNFNATMNVEAETRLTHYVNFVLLLPLGFGIAFQLPVVMLFLQRIGILETEAYISSWRIAVLIIFVIAMIVTPADVTSMVALAIPLVFLYVLGIAMCKFMPRGRGMGSDAYDPA